MGNCKQTNKNRAPFITNTCAYIEESADGGILFKVIEYIEYRLNSETCLLAFNTQGYLKGLWRTGFWVEKVWFGYQFVIRLNELLLAVLMDSDLLPRCDVTSIDNYTWSSNANLAESPTCTNWKKKYTISTMDETLK